jgi:hypothetical protein
MKDTPQPSIKAPALKDAKVPGAKIGIMAGIIPGAARAGEAIAK